MGEDLGCAFCRILARIRWIPAKSDRDVILAKNETPEYHNTTLVIQVHSSWY
jgi:hypothetical protein